MKMKVASLFLLVSVVAVGQKKVSDEKIAEPIVINGDVRFKRGGEMNWRKLTSDVSLSVGDLIYVDTGSSLQLKYIKEEASITLSSNSIFEIDKTLPASTRQKRAFANSNLSSAPLPKAQDESGNFTRTLAAPSDTRDDKNTNVGGLIIDRYIRKLRVFAPAGDSTIVSATYPAVFTVVTEEIPNVKLNGYLWEEGGNAPVWSGLGVPFFSEIKIEREGKYIFQAFSEDERFATVPIKIKALRTNDGNLLPKEWDGKYTVFVR